MEKHLQQAEYNKKFLLALITDYPDQYNDWKVTVAFYVAIHLVKAFGLLHNVDLGKTHVEIFQKISPRLHKKPKGFKDWICESYSTLFRNSQGARYDGFLDIEDHEEMFAGNFVHSYEKLIALEKFILGEVDKSKRKKVSNAKSGS